VIDLTGKELRVRVRRQAGAREAVQVGDELLEEGGTDLHLADAGLGLRIDDAEACVAARGTCKWA
jgi:hypothetical protein